MRVTVFVFKVAPFEGEDNVGVERVAAHFSLE
jgi:hypothetical protein